MTTLDSAIKLAKEMTETQLLTSYSIHSKKIVLFRDQLEITMMH